MKPDLLFSEISLNNIPDRKFSLHSWIIGDKFMKFSIELVTKTLLNLFQEKQIELDFVYEDFKLFNVKILTIKKTFIISKFHTIDSHDLGWLEKKILDVFAISKRLPLNAVVYDLLESIFSKGNKFTNPGKILLCEMLKNQRLHLFNFDQISSWLNISITITNTINNSLFFYNPKEEKLNSEYLRPYQEIIHKAVKKEFAKFHDVGD
jgi:hypothetical protein